MFIFFVFANDNLFNVITMRLLLLKLILIKLYVFSIFQFYSILLRFLLHSFCFFLIVVISFCVNFWNLSINSKHKILIFSEFLKRKIIRIDCFDVCFNVCFRRFCWFCLINSWKTITTNCSTLSWFSRININQCDVYYDNLQRSNS